MRLLLVGLGCVVGCVACWCGTCALVRTCTCIHNKIRTVQFYNKMYLCAIAKMREHAYGDGWFVSVDNKDSWHKVGALKTVSVILSGLGYGPVSAYLLWSRVWQYEDKLSGRNLLQHRRHRELPPGCAFTSGCRPPDGLCDLRDGGAKHGQE